MHQFSFFLHKKEREKKKYLWRDLWIRVFLKYILHKRALYSNVCQMLVFLWKQLLKEIPQTDNTILHKNRSNEAKLRNAFTICSKNIKIQNSRKWYKHTAGFHRRHDGHVGVVLTKELWLFLLFGTPTWPLWLLSFVSLGTVWKPRIKV